MSIELKKIMDNMQDDAHPVYHQFLQCYRKNDNIVYGFVEGKEDPLFYKSKISDQLPINWDINLFTAGDKKNVLTLLKEYRWERYNLKRVLFYIDRDLSDFIDENIPNIDTLYVTDQYSVENEVVSSYVCRRVLEEYFNFSTLSETQLREYISKFQIQLEIFKEKLVTIMCWFIFWWRKKIKVSIKVIELKQLFRFNSGEITLKSDADGNPINLINYLHMKTGQEYKDSNDVYVKEIEREFLEKRGKEHFIRGKFLLWFFVKFLNSLYESIENSPKKHADLGINNAMLLISHCPRIPDSLRDFISNNYLEYIKFYENETVRGARH